MAEVGATTDWGGWGDDDPELEQALSWLLDEEGSATTASPVQNPAENVTITEVQSNDLLAPETPRSFYGMPHGLESSVQILMAFPIDAPFDLFDDLSVLENVGPHVDAETFRKSCITAASNDPRVYGRLVSLALFHLMLLTPAHKFFAFISTAVSEVRAFLRRLGLVEPEPERVKREMTFHAKRMGRGWADALQKFEVRQDAKQVRMYQGFHNTGVVNGSSIGEHTSLTQTTTGTASTMHDFDASISRLDHTVSKFSSAAKKHLRAFDQEGRDAISDFRAEGKNVLEWFKKKARRAAKKWRVENEHPPTASQHQKRSKNPFFTQMDDDDEEDDDDDEPW